MRWRLQTWFTKLLTPPKRAVAVRNRRGRKCSKTGCRRISCGVSLTLPSPLSPPGERGRG